MMHWDKSGRSPVHREVIIGWVAYALVLLTLLIPSIVDLVADYPDGTRQERSVAASENRAP